MDTPQRRREEQLATRSQRAAPAESVNRTAILRSPSLMAHAFSIAGHRDNVGGAFGDLWPVSTSMVYPTSAAVPVLSSSSASDAPGGTGAVRVRIVGWTENWGLESEEVTTNGTSAVSATKKYWRILSARCIAVGSSGGNVGDINVTIGGNTAAYVAFIDNRSQQAHFTIPPGYEGTVENLRVSAALGGGQIDFGAARLFARFDGSGPFFTIEELQFGGGVRPPGSPRIVLPGPADIVLRVFASGAGSSKRVAGGYDVRLRGMSEYDARSFQF